MKVNTIIFYTILISSLWLQCANNSNLGDKIEALSQQKTMENRDLIAISNAELEDLEKIIQDFCDIYNAKSKIVFPKLTVYSDNHYEITFNKDIEFEIMCYFVNYLHYPFDIEYSPKILAWTMIKSNTSLVDNKLKSKEIMMYIPEEDTEFDYVCFVTKDDENYKNGFAVGEGIMKLEDHKMKFLEMHNFKRNGEILKIKNFE